jgi:hypothetical protein
MICATRLAIFAVRRSGVKYSLLTLAEPRIQLQLSMPEYDGLALKPKVACPWRQEEE